MLRSVIPEDGTLSPGQTSYETLKVSSRGFPGTSKVAMLSTNFPPEPSSFTYGTARTSVMMFMRRRIPRRAETTTPLYLSNIAL